MWISQQGVVACGERGHGGVYLHSAIEGMRVSGRYTSFIDTPLDNWVELTRDVIDATGRSDIKCEQCREEEQRADRPERSTA